MRRGRSWGELNETGLRTLYLDLSRLFLLTAPNDDLFYAFAGANLKLNGRITKVGTFDTPTKHYLKFDVKATIAITDDYTFEPKGPLGSRLWFEAYDAANFLQERLQGNQYQPFPVAVAFARTYVGLRSDRIGNGAFNTERPIRPGEPIPPPY